VKRHFKRDVLDGRRYASSPYGRAVLCEDDELGQGYDVGVAGARRGEVAPAFGVLLATVSTISTLRWRAVNATDLCHVRKEVRQIVKVRALVESLLCALDEAVHELVHGIVGRREALWHVALQFYEFRDAVVLCQVCQ
jgi:hypothetical protein